MSIFFCNFAEHFFEVFATLDFFLELRDASMHVLWWCATLIFCFFQPLIDQLLAHLIMKRSYDIVVLSDMGP